MRQTPALEHLRSPSNNYPTMVLFLGLRSCVLLPSQFGRMGIPAANDWTHRVACLDVHEQIHQTSRPLHPIPGRLLPIANIDHLWLLAWPDQSKSYAFIECCKSARFSEPAISIPARRIWLSLYVKLTTDFFVTDGMGHTGWCR